MKLYIKNNPNIKYCNIKLTVSLFMNNETSDKINIKNPIIKYFLSLFSSKKELPTVVL